MWDGICSGVRWLMSNRRIEVMQAELSLCKQRIEGLESAIADLRRIVEEKTQSEHQLKDDLRYSESERQRLAAMYHDLLIENRQLRISKGR